LISGLNLVSILKGTTKNENPLDFIKSGVNTVLDLIIGLALGKNRSIKGFLSAVLVEKFTTMLIDNNLTNIISGISMLMHRNKKMDAETNTK